MNNKDDFYTIDEIAEKLKVTKKSILNQIHQGRAGKSIPPYIKIGQLVRFPIKDYEEWLENLSEWRKNI